MAHPVFLALVKMKLAYSSALHPANDVATALVMF